MLRSLLVALLLAGVSACGSRGGQGAQPRDPSHAEAATEPAPQARAEPEPEPPSSPDGYVEMDAVGVASGGGGSLPPDRQAVGLMDRERKVVVLIWIGGTEALTIALRLHDQPFTRPLTHDLLDSMLEELGAELWKVQVDDLVDGVFIGSVFLRKGGEIVELDARPSDAIAMAVGHDVPIYVAQKVIDMAGQSADFLLEQKEGDSEETTPGEMPPAPELPEKRSP